MIAVVEDEYDGEYCCLCSTHTWLSHKEAIWDVWDLSEICLGSDLALMCLGIQPK